RAFQLCERWNEHAAGHGCEDEASSDRPRWIRGVTVEGRVAIGLDEFMLRLGHLSALTEIAADVGASRNRVLRAFAEWLTHLTPVLPGDYANLGTYLVRKKLARVAQSGREEKEPQTRARYAEYVIRLSSDGRVEDIVPPAGEPITVWREDHLLADPRTPSKVGAVTVETRDITNKSGVSHLIDWALALDVLDRNLSL